MPWTEKRSRLAMRFETSSINTLHNIDTYNFTDVLKLSWNQAWNIIERAVKRRMERKIGNPSIISIDTKSYKKGHKYITLIYDMINNGVEYISYDKKKSLDQYDNTLSKEQIPSITAMSMDICDLFMSPTLEHAPDAGKIAARFWRREWMISSERDT